MKILIILFLLSFNCKNTEFDETNKRKVAEVQKKYREKIKNDYNIENSSKSKEEAVQIFLYSISQGNQEQYIYNKNEYLDIFLPNSIDENTLISQMEPDKAWQITELRRINAFQSLKNILFKKEFKILEIQWKDNRSLKSLIGYPIGNIKIEVSGIIHNIEEIKLVLEHKSKFKVCVISK